jgi:hypothetical protein
MQLNPHTTLRKLLIAIPSAVVVCARFQIPISGNEEVGLGDLCVRHGIGFASFVEALDALNWDEDYVPKHDSCDTNRLHFKGKVGFRDKTHGIRRPV